MGSRIDFLPFKTSLAFTQLKKAFTKAPILYHFDFKCHIQIKTNPLNYAINKILSQLSFEIDLASQVTHKSNN